MGAQFNNGRVIFDSGGLVDFWHSAADAFYEDVRVTVQHGNNVVPTANDYMGAVARRIDADNMLIAAVTGTRLHVMKLQGGSLYDLVSSALPVVLAAGHYWVRIVCDGDLITAEHWTGDPQFGGNPATSLSYHLTVAEQAIFMGNHTYTVGGLAWEVNSWATGWLEDLYYEPVRISSMVVFDVVNIGNFTAKPIVEFMGGQTEIVLTNQANDSQMIITGDIPEGKRYFANVIERTFTDEDGNNVYDQWATASKWMKLEDGVNRIVIDTEGNQGNSGLRVTWHDSWM